MVFIGLWLVKINSYANQAVEELWLSVRLNEQKRADTLVFLRTPDDGIWIAEQDWQQWRLKKQNVVVYSYNQQNYYNLKQIQGLTYQLNEQDLAIDINAPISLFEPLSLNETKAIEVVEPTVSKGLFVNYDVNSGFNRLGMSDSSLLLENGFFHPFGVFNSQSLITLPVDEPQKVIRLDSTFTHNRIDQMTTFRVGDTQTTDFGHIGSMRIGGIQSIRNFSLQPKKNITPMLSMTGEASMPSNVDVFINNMRAFSQKVPIGAFEINNIPAITGKGEASMVIRDILGREQRVYLPYYINPEALQVGLHEFSYDLGLIRENYGLDSDRYGRWLFNTLHRVGLSEYVTGQAQLALAQNQQNISAGVVFSVANQAAVEALISYSHHQKYGQGQAFSMGFATQIASFNINNHFKWQSEEFAALSRSDNSVNSQFSESFFIGRPISKALGSLAVAYHHQQSYDAQQFESIQLNYNANIQSWFNLSASLTKVLSNNQDVVALLSLSIPLGAEVSANLHLQPQQGQQSLSLQKNSLSTTGLNYGLQHSWGNSQRTQANLTLQNNWGQYRFNANYAGEDVAVQGSASGGFAVMDKHLFWSRRINSSFAVLKVGEYKDVKVYKNNQLVGKTNAQGLALIPQLLPYQANRLRIDANDLPFDVVIPNLEKAVVPAFRSGLYTDFAIKRAYGATMTLQLASGEMIPAGAIIDNLTTGEQILSGYNGQIYLSDLQAMNHIRVSWLKNQCEFNLAFVPKDDNSVPDLGKQICQQQQP